MWAWASSPDTHGRSDTYRHTGIGLYVPQRKRRLIDIKIAEEQEIKCEVEKYIAKGQKEGTLINI